MLPGYRRAPSRKKQQCRSPDSCRDNVNLSVKRRRGAAYSAIECRYTQQRGRHWRFLEGKIRAKRTKKKQTKYIIATQASRSLTCIFDWFQSVLDDVVLHATVTVWFALCNCRGVCYSADLYLSLSLLFFCVLVYQDYVPTIPPCARTLLSLWISIFLCAYLAPFCYCLIIIMTAISCSMPFFFFSVASFTLFSALSVVADGYCAVGASEIVDADWDGRIPISRKLA